MLSNASIFPFMLFYCFPSPIFGYSFSSPLPLGFFCPFPVRHWPCMLWLSRTVYLLAMFSAYLDRLFECMCSLAILDRYLGCVCSVHISNAHFNAISSTGIFTVHFDCYFDGAFWLRILTLHVLWEFLTSTWVMHVLCASWLHMFLRLFLCIFLSFHCPLF